MVNYQTDSLSSVFGALADATRRAILDRLAGGECRVSELAQPFNVSLPAVSKHIRVLEQAGLLRRDIDGRVHRCRIDARPLEEAAEWVERYRRFWEGQFDALARYLARSPKEDQRWRKKKIHTMPSKSGGGSRRPGRKSSVRGRPRQP